ncbi:MAG: Abi family protein [Chloroflexi bacterium]|nr:MAG: Abi family protein [Chloroflexota bacterium]
MTIFEKSAQTIEQHISMLKERGLEISDEARARHYLSHISYYRLSAYMHPFYVPCEPEHRFLPGTCFEDVLSLYIFDRELRLLLLDAIERIEVSLRSHMTNTLAEHHGPYGYLDAKIFDTRFDHKLFLEKLENVLKGKDAETFVIHYRRRYPNSPEHPPVWMAMELLTFSTVSILLANLKEKADTKRIEGHYGWRLPVLKSWFRALSVLRNKCAHHMRVWNREFGVFPSIPKQKPDNWPNIPSNIPAGSTAHTEQTIQPQRRLYMQLVVIESLMRTVAPESKWGVRMVRLLNRYPQFSRPHMGFPHDWKSQMFWRETVAEAES